MRRRGIALLAIALAAVLVAPGPGLGDGGCQRRRGGFL